MATQHHTTKSPSNHNFAARVGRWSVQHRRKAILGWLAFVFVAMAVGFNLVPQKNIEPMDGMPGESGKAGQILNDAYPDKAAEQVLVQSKTLDASDPAVQGRGRRRDPAAGAHGRRRQGRPRR